MELAADCAVSHSLSSCCAVCGDDSADAPAPANGAHLHASPSADGSAQRHPDNPRSHSHYYLGGGSRSGGRTDPLADPDRNSRCPSNAGSHTRADLDSHVLSDAGPHGHADVIPDRHTDPQSRSHGNATSHRR